MVTSASLKDQLAERVRTIEQLTAGLSDGEAGQAPSEGEWCVKEVLSHLAGSETKSFYDGIKAFLDEDTPEYEVTPGQSYLDSDRSGLTVAELRSRVIDEYSRIGELLGGLSEEQLNRKAHMPAFKETPLGEYPALSLWASAMVNYHLPDHIAQLQTLCK
jgi:hypothetical protein